MENKFKSRLIDLRKSMKLSQSQLAKEINCTQAAIAMWEEGSRTPTMNYIISLALYFGVTSDFLLGLKD